MSNRRGHLTPKLRRARILALVREQGQVSVEDLAEAFDASHETIRRDLSQLAEAGSLQKVHGGAKLPHLALRRIRVNSTSHSEPEKWILDHL